MNKKKLLSLFGLSFFLSIYTTYAHCPLCTIGAAAVAGGASFLGVKIGVIGIFIGAFAISIGFWMARIIKKKYFKFQNFIVIIVIFLTTIIPIIPFFVDYYALYIPFLGEYGTTYALNLFVIGNLFGAFLVYLSPILSKKLTKFRKGKIILYQGMILNFTILLITGVIIQLML